MTLNQHSRQPSALPPQLYSHPTALGWCSLVNLPSLGWRLPFPSSVAHVLAGLRAAARGCCLAGLPPFLHVLAGPHNIPRLGFASPPLPTIPQDPESEASPFQTGGQSQRAAQVAHVGQVAPLPLFQQRLASGRGTTPLAPGVAGVPRARPKSCHRRCILLSENPLQPPRVSWGFGHARILGTSHQGENSLKHKQKSVPAPPAKPRALIRPQEKQE
uniref:Uncharacterized protein n=1 Tax=Sphaerodactylus townsendi TaxID=933632 RepID=A0ACB8F1M4_9SAUR